MTATIENGHARQFTRTLSVYTDLGSVDHETEVGMASVSAVARLLGVDKSILKGWTARFAEHLSLNASPLRGKA
jgi:hypothetical protein